MLLTLIAAGLVTIAAQPKQCVGVHVGGSIQQAINENPPGTTFCLSGTYQISQTIRPKAGDTFDGPASITGSPDIAFELKPQAPNVTFRDLTVSGFSLHAIRCWEGTQVIGGRYHHNGRNGIGCGLDNHGGVLIDGVEVDHNGSVDELGRGGGGMKFARSGGVVVTDSYVHDNIGNGVWCDVDCGAFEVTDSTVSGNSRKGIFFEISRGPLLIENNIVTDNNCCPPQGAGAPGGGIATNSSCPVSAPGMCVIRGNVLGGNMVAGINHRDDSRPYARPFDIVVEDNDLNGDAILRCGEFGIVCSGNV